VESLFPGSFAPGFLADLAAGARVAGSRYAAGLPLIRHTRPRRGWTRALLPLIETPGRRARFLARTLFPPPGEVRANAAADGSSLAAAYVRLAASRLAALIQRR
jgi:hypothetical protein